MKIKRASTLACTFENGSAVVHNFLDRTLHCCNGRTLDLLASLNGWAEIETVLARLPAPREERAQELRQLLAAGLLVAEGGPEAERDARYTETWRWGAVAGFYHFSLRDSEFIDGMATVDRLRSYGGPATSPPLLTSNDGLSEIVDLPAFDIDDPFFGTLYARRSRRQFASSPLPLHVLADCLYAGNGLQDILDGGEFGRLPLTMTASGGARNPFELYVYARNVQDLREGFHHYSAVEHSLGLLHAEELPLPSELLAGQKWADDAAAIVFLCANFPRPAWKYRHALAYRVVLMEVGCIVQNMQLAATRHDVSAAPTGALAESRIEALLELEGITQAALFALVIGKNR